MRQSALAALFCFALLSGCVSDSDDDSDDTQTDPAATDGRNDATVIAVVDGGFNPYHWDMLASKMPQHQNSDPTDDLPLWESPDTWLPGFPNPSDFASYEALNITMPANGDVDPTALRDQDADEWANQQTSSAGSVHLRWIPGTKVVGFVTFGGGGYDASSHGVGTSSVSVGNLHGSCPECLLVFVDGTSEQANRWVESQDWIDAQTNSWGISTLGTPRDRVYTGSDTNAQRTAVERGQQIFFSAGNGLMNDFTAPNPTLMSSQEGPDWIVTVAAVTPTDHSAYSGSGKPADIANIGSAYPSAGGGTVTANATFGGTSNATPVTAGLYGRALYMLRREMAGPSRIQENGTVSVGNITCVMAPCAVEDGVLTVHELRTALFTAARDLNDQISVNGNPVPTLSPEETFAAIGHGTFLGRFNGDGGLDMEVELIVNATKGQFTEMPQDEKDWFVADSFCRQAIWGDWDFGDASGVTLPDPDPQWPVRTWYTTSCPAVLGTAKTVVETGTFR